MPPKSNRSSSTSQKRGKSVDETVETSEAVSPSTKSGKSQGEPADSQTKIDKHLKQLKVAAAAETSSHLDETLKFFSEKLNDLASQEYIENKFKEIVTEDFLSSKLKDLEIEIKNQVKKEFEKVYKRVGELEHRVTTAEKSVFQLRNTVSDMEVSLEKMQEKNIEILKESQNMKEQLNEREVKIKAQSEQINNLEQYTRRNSVRIYGVDDQDKDESTTKTAQKVVDLVRDKLSIDITINHIDIAHRMGKFSADGNRPIICKFVTRFTKHAVIKARKLLKGSSQVIREDLTLQNAKLLENTSAEDKVKTAWSDEGKVIALLKNGSKIVVDRHTDFNKIIIPIEQEQ